MGALSLWQWLENRHPALAGRLPPSRHGGVLMLISRSLQGWLSIGGKRQEIGHSVLGQPRKVESCTRGSDFRARRRWPRKSGRSWRWAIVLRATATGRSWLDRPSEVRGSKAPIHTKSTLMLSCVEMSIARSVFEDLDRNHDGVLEGAELRVPRQQQMVPLPMGAAASLVATLRGRYSRWWYRF